MHLKINLANPASIQTAIDRLQKTIDEGVLYENAMVRQVADRLLNTMKLNVDKYEGLSGSWAQESLRIEEFDIGGGRIGCRIVGEDYILFIEYGTGIYAESGGRQTPWVYFNENVQHFVTTHGMEPRPFIRTSIEEIRSTMHEEVEVMISEWIASK